MSGNELYPEIGTVTNGQFTAISEVAVLSNRDVETGIKYLTYTINSDDPLNALDELKVLYPSPHFKGDIIANAEVTAKVEQPDGSVQDIATVSKGPMTLSFEPVADPVTFVETLSSTETDEDRSISIKSLFFDGNTSRAFSDDPSEEIMYVISGMPDGTRLIDGEALKDTDGNDLNDVVLSLRAIKIFR